ncbi:hypothetical protein DFH11DRAFT_1547948 [Phellopilus nigrolimitatus]|nr:hypothetical protein DFH11DRAFT_1547948 [Phellopilus nigrolimitatus]
MSLISAALTRLIPISVILALKDKIPRKAPTLQITYAASALWRPDQKSESPRPWCTDKVKPSDILFVESPDTLPELDKKDIRSSRPARGSLHQTHPQSSLKTASQEMATWPQEIKIPYSVISISQERTKKNKIARTFRVEIKTRASAGVNATQADRAK